MRHPMPQPMNDATFERLRGLMPSVPAGFIVEPMAAETFMKLHLHHGEPS